ncbi:MULTISPECIES: c-type cytochrome [unclassified Neptuniibacter]|uniref:c-type cytochrome n=1 Tax=unclassified Neptuniibacter TaxID=2630693 RepID=UPI000C3508FE|nr:MULTISPECIES: c-type cytochrome [unclassified Neptuniibacter]MAY41909.1 cytochrome c5 family protein [Oceanospirillaceae bacterium]
MKKITSALVALGLGIALSASVQATSNDEAVAERIKAVGSVCIEGDDSCGGAAAAPVAAGGTRSSEEIYTSKCAGCHATGAAGAPKYGTPEWADRGAKGMESLLASAISGVGAMPPRGLCMDCSDEELQGAIQHMLDSSK